MRLCWSCLAVETPAIPPYGRIPADQDHPREIFDPGDRRVLDHAPGAGPGAPAPASRPPIPAARCWEAALVDSQARHRLHPSRWTAPGWELLDQVRAGSILTIAAEWPPRSLLDPGGECLSVEVRARASEWLAVTILQQALEGFNRHGLAPGGELVIELRHVLNVERV